MDETHPMHPRHPMHPDNHHHRSHHPHAHNLKVMLIIYMVAVIILMVAFGALSGAPFGNVMLSFSPAILLGVAALALLESDRFDTRYLLLILLTLLVLAGALLPVLAPGADLGAVLGLNLVLGALLVILLGASHPHREPTRVVEKEPQEQDIPEMIATIEDRCKAINAVIGRAYSVHHGGTAGLRDKIKIDAEWYNEVSAAMEDADHNRPIIRGVVERIRVRLVEMQKPEKDVFTEVELDRLKALQRDPKGRTPVLTVLDDNDSDPVGIYHASALEYCELALTRLQD